MMRAINATSVLLSITLLATAIIPLVRPCRFALPSSAPQENNYVQMTVNASALPKGTKNMDVTVKYLIETGKGPFFHTVQLPVVDAGPQNSCLSGQPKQVRVCRFALHPGLSSLVACGITAV